MAYDPTIPVVANVVRGATGDLVKMKENFVHLDPVATSGLHGLLSGGESVASGQVPVTQGGAGSAWHYVGYNLNRLTNVVIAAPASGQALTYDGSDWVNATPNTTLSGLTDTVIAAPTSGQALTFDGDDWVNDTPVTSLAGLSDTAVGGAASGEALIYDGADWVAGGSVGREHYAVIKTADQTGIAAGSFVQVSGFTEAHAGSGGFDIVTSGIKVDSDAISEVDVVAGVKFSSSNNQVIATRVTLNGVALSGIVGYRVGFVVRDDISVGAAGIPAQQVVAGAIPVTSGDVIGLQVFFDGGATKTVLSGENSYIHVQDNAQAPGGSGGGSSNEPKIGVFSMASGAHYTLTNLQQEIISGITVTHKNTGGFTLSSGTVTMPTGSGITHIRVTAEVTYSGQSPAGVGWRDAILYRNGSSIWYDIDDTTLLGFFSYRVASNPTNGGFTNLALTTSLLPVSDGDTISLAGVSLAAGTST